MVVDRLSATIVALLAGSVASIDLVFGGVCYVCQVPPRFR